MESAYQLLKNDFESHLDGAADYNALLLETMPVVYTICRDNYIMPEHQEQVFDGVRTIWDIAYNYGFHDAVTELAPKDSLTYE